jgi:hypothetical protein
MLRPSPKSRPSWNLRWPTNADDHATVSAAWSRRFSARLTSWAEKGISVRGAVEQGGASTRDSGQVTGIQAAVGKLGVFQSRVKGGRCQLPEEGRERVGRPGHDHTVDVAIVDSLLPDDRRSERGPARELHTH